MHDKRRITRRHLLYYLRIFNAETGELMGDIGDLTPEGLMLVSASPLTTGREYRLRMKLPAETFRNREFEFRARSIWCRSDETGTKHNTGFQVLDTEKRDLETIVGLITDSGVQE